MEQKDIDKIAETIATKIGGSGGNQLMGCGSASSSEYYGCNSGTYSCDSYYECGGAASFNCTDFNCNENFYCAGHRFQCVGHHNCYHTYSYD